MSETPITLARLEEVMAKGFNWKTRVEEAGSLLHWFLQAKSPPGVVYTNGRLALALLKEVGGPQTRVSGIFRKMSSFITSAGRLAEFKSYIRQGPEMKTYINGEMVHVRTRLWKADGEEKESPAPDLSEEDVRQKIIELTSLGYRVLALGEDKEVDTGEFTKHPTPGSTPVMCGHCGGTGKMHRRKQS